MVILATTYQCLGDFKRAIDYHKRQLQIAKELGERSGEGVAYGNLGNAHQSLGDFKIAVDYHERRLKIAKETGDKTEQGRAYGSLGNAYGSLHDFKKAIHYHQRHLKIAKELGDRSGQQNAYGNLGNDHQSLGDFETAIDYHERSLKIAKELGDSIGTAVSVYALGVCFQYLGRVVEALECYQCSVTMFNNVRDRLQLNDKWKISLRDNYQVVYTSLWRLLLKQGKIMEALFAAEQGRAQALKDLMELNYACETTDTGLGTDIRTIHELLSFLPPNTIFIAMEKDEIIFWVCQKGKNIKLRRKQIKSPENMISNFLQYVSQIARLNICVTADALSTLHKTIIEPIQDLLLGNELIFVPEGSLSLAPFAALKGAKYLCESFRIRVIPSLTSLKLIADCPSDYHSTSGALLVGDPWVQEVTNLQQLPCARQEVEMIGRILHTVPLIGKEATKGAVLKRLSSVALVHFAAHGQMETGEIALAPNPTSVLCKPMEEDFMLMMRDVLSVQMRARLVVLSCSHSACGEIKAEGVVGIARAFLGAGARSVLVSLWDVDDAATLEFMKSFYQHLSKGRSASDALNQAMKMYERI